MSATNVATFQAAHEEFNRREFDALLKRLSENCSYRDHSRGETYEGREAFREFLNGWVTAFSDARVAEPTYLDAGTVVISEFRARGTSAAGASMDLPMCEIMRFNDRGEVIGGGLYYDQLTMLTQLGLAQNAGSAAGASR